MAAGAAMKRPGSAITRTCFGNLASAARIGATELVDRRHSVVVRDREAAADIEHVERGQPSEQRLGDQSSCRRWIASTYFAGSVACEPTWNDKPRTRMPSRRAISIRPSTAPGSQPNLRDRSTTAFGLRKDTRNSKLGALAIAHELPDLVRIVGDEGRHAVAQRVANVAVALDRMRVDAALGRDALRLDQFDFAGRGEIEKRAFVAQAGDDGRVRQRLQRVMKVDAGQRSFQRVVLAAHLLAVEDEQRRAETGRKATDFGFRQRRRVEGMSGRDGRVNAWLRVATLLGDLIAKAAKHT